MILPDCRKQILFFLSTLIDRSIILYQVPILEWARELQKCIVRNREFGQHKMKDNNTQLDNLQKLLPFSSFGCTVAHYQARNKMRFIIGLFFFFANILNSPRKEGVKAISRCFKFLFYSVKTKLHLFISVIR